MHNVKLVAGTPFHNNCELTVMDMTEGQERKRCKITVDYAKYDIEQLIDRGYDLEQTLAHYEDWIYHTVKRYIADEWECVNGYEEILGIIESRIKAYF